MNKTNDKNSKVAVGYCRVSTDDQADQGISLDYQEEQCKKAAEKDGYNDNEVLIIRDEGKSGTNLKRKGIQEIIDLAKKREISIVYVTHSDRLARNIVDHAFLRNTLRANNITLKYLNGQSSLDDASSIMADNMFATINQYHSDNTREKTKQAVDTKAEAGYFPTHAPVGYINTSNPNKNCEKVAKRIIIPNPKTGLLVTEAFKTYATGQYNAYELNDLMYAKGLVSNSEKKLSPSMVYAMLKNKVYLGEIHWMDIHNKNGKHEPLIDKDTFNQVQNILSERNQNRCRRRKYFWLLNGYMFCAEHNCRYTAEWHLNKSKAYYHCSNKKGCGKYVEKSDLEKQVAQKFKHLEFNQEFINSIIEKVKSIFDERKNVYQSAQKTLQSRKNACNAKLSSAENRLLDETLSKEDYLRIKEAVIADTSRIDKELNNLQIGHDINIDLTSEILGFTKNIYNTYMQAPEELQKKFISLFFEGFDVKDGLIVKDRYSPLFQELLNLNALSIKSPYGRKAVENKGKEKLILDTSRGGYRESNPNCEFHKLEC